MNPAVGAATLAAVAAGCSEYIQHTYAFYTLASSSASRRSVGMSVVPMFVYVCMRVFIGCCAYMDVCYYVGKHS